MHGVCHNTCPKMLASFDTARENQGNMHFNHEEGQGDSIESCMEVWTTIMQDLPAKERTKVKQNQQWPQGPSTWTRAALEATSCFGYRMVRLQASTPQDGVIPWVYVRMNTCFRCAKRDTMSSNCPMEYRAGMIDVNPIARILLFWLASADEQTFTAMFALNSNICLPQKFAHMPAKR
jgi:hypothetical protein